jgi:hypothetical protein
VSYVTPKLNWGIEFYNFSDFNRVENNTIETSNLLNSNGYKCTLGSTITNRTNVSLDFYDSLNRIENNVSLLQQALGYLPAGWITPVTSWSYNMPFDFNTANRLENDIDFLYTMVNNISNYFNYAGQFGGTYYCGQDNTYL